MIKPEELKHKTSMKEMENIKFRTYLKCNVGEEELDKQFLELHNELFGSYDCSACRNCCKEFHCIFEDDEDIEKALSELKINKDQFIKKYLNYNEDNKNYQSKHKPCDFLLENGSCSFNNNKPNSCKEYPYTNKPGRLWSLYSMLEAIEVCPVAYEIWERLKQIYGFKTKNHKI